MKRVIDINGDIICEPIHYWDCLRSGVEMIDKMESEGVDRSDMHVIINKLAFELQFQVSMLKRTSHVDKDRQQDEQDELTLGYSSV